MKKLLLSSCLLAMSFSTMATVAHENDVKTCLTKKQDLMQTAFAELQNRVSETVLKRVPVLYKKNELQTITNVALTNSKFTLNPAPGLISVELDFNVVAGEDSVELAVIFGLSPNLSFIAENYKKADSIGRVIESGLNCSLQSSEKETGLIDYKIIGLEIVNKESGVVIDKFDQDVSLFSTVKIK